MGQDLDLLVEEIREDDGSRDEAFAQLSAHYDRQLRGWSARKAALHGVPYRDVRAAADIGLWKAAQKAVHTGDFWKYAQEWMHGELFEQQGWRRKKQQEGGQDVGRPLIEYLSHKLYRHEGELAIRRWLRKSGTSKRLRALLDLAGDYRGLYTALESYQSPAYFEGNPYRAWTAYDLEIMAKHDRTPLPVIDWSRLGVRDTIHVEFWERIGQRVKTRFADENCRRLYELYQLLQDVQRLPEDLMKTTLLYGIYQRRRGYCTRPLRYPELRDIASRLQIDAPAKPFGERWDIRDPFLDNKRLSQTTSHMRLDNVLYATIRQRLRSTRFPTIMRGVKYGDWGLWEPQKAYPTIDERFSKRTTACEKNGMYSMRQGEHRLYFPQIGLLNTPDDLAELERVLRPTTITTVHVQDCLGKRRELPMFLAKPPVMPGQPYRPPVKWDDDVPF
jgi:hypothetical protein